MLSFDLLPTRQLQFRLAAIYVFIQENTPSQSTTIHGDNYFFFVFTAASCERLNNCSGRGNCTDLNFCVCESGSYGFNCSLGEYFRAESVGTR